MPGLTECSLTLTRGVGDTRTQQEMVSSHPDKHSEHRPPDMESLMCICAEHIMQLPTCSLMQESRGLLQWVGHGQREETYQNNHGATKSTDECREVDDDICLVASLDALNGCESLGELLC